MPARGENYGQFLNLLELVLWLEESASGVSLAEIAQRFGVTRRTAERMRDAVANYFGGDFEERREGTQKFFKLRARRLDSVTLASITDIPLGFLYGDRQHYLVARCADAQKAGKPYHFILSRILAVERFGPSTDFGRKIQSRKNVHGLGPSPWPGRRRLGLCGRL